MNFATVSTLVIRLFCAYQVFLVLDDVSYLLAKHATDPRFDLYVYYGCRMSARAFIAAIIYSVSIPMGKRITKDLLGLTKQD
jgi:hypothetical protein